MPDEPVHTELDQSKVNSLLQRRKAEQNMPLALAAGIVAALVGAVIWAVVTDMTGYQVGWMAVGVGFLVGYAVQFAGKGIEPPFQYVGAVCALLGCILGNYFAVIGNAAHDANADILSTILGIPLDKAIAVMQTAFQPMDLLFYAIAVYEGYRFSLKRLTPAELAELH